MSSNEVCISEIVFYSSPSNLLNGARAKVRSVGKGSLTLQLGQTTQDLHTVLASLRAPITWTWVPAWDMSKEGPQWQRERCKDKNNREVKWSLLESMGGCCCQKENSELERRPPTIRRPPSPMKWLRDESVLDARMGLPVDKRCRSSRK